MNMYLLLSSSWARCLSFECHGSDSIGADFERTSSYERNYIVGQTGIKEKRRLREEDRTNGGQIEWKQKTPGEHRKTTLYSNVF